MTAPSLEHKSRRGWLGRPVVWRLQGTTLSMMKGDRAGQTFQLRDIREVRLHVRPSRFWEHYVCELRRTDDRMLQICDEYAWLAVLKISSRDTYCTFVTALCAALASEKISCRFRAGPRRSSYLLAVLVMAAAIYLIAQFMVSHTGMTEADARWLLAFGFGLILLKSPYWRKANRLIEFDPTDIPEGLLSRKTGAAGARS